MNVLIQRSTKQGIQLIEYRRNTKYVETSADDIHHSSIGLRSAMAVWREHVFMTMKVAYSKWIGLPSPSFEVVLLTSGRLILVPYPSISFTTAVKVFKESRIVLRAGRDGGRKLERERR